MINLVNAVHDKYLAVTFQHILITCLIKEKFNDLIELVLFVLSESVFAF